MADLRKARREAEKTARDALSGTLVGTAGELGVAQAAQKDAAESISVARAKAAAIVAAAKREADAVIAAAEVESRNADKTYADTWHAAKNAGWSATQLRGMGYNKAPAQRKTTDRSPAGSPPSAAVA